MTRMKVIAAHFPGGMSCRDAEDFIDRYLDGELSVAQKLKFKIHIATCVECHAYLRAYEASRAIAKSIMGEGDEDVGPMPDDLVQAILAAR